MRRYLLLALTCIIGSCAYAQDTITVQTLTYDSLGRDYMFDFPPDDGTSYEKIIMEYSMRCTDALVSTPSDRNKGCGEWDYSCNTYVIDSSRVDSLPASHPSHIISGFGGDVYDYTSMATNTYTRYIQKETAITNGTNGSEVALSLGEAALTHPFTSSSTTGRTQYLYTAAELSEAGAVAGPIAALRLENAEAGAMGFLRVRIAQVTDTELSAPMVDESALTQVYFSDTELAPGSTNLVFYQAFDWDGVSNLLVDMSFTNTAEATAISVAGGGGSGMASSGANHHLVLSGAEYLELGKEGLGAVSDEITISVWTYGDEAALPRNTSIFEGVDAQNNRQVNVHLPWSNGLIYWDCGNVGGYDRIQKTADPSDFAGKWSHWTFTKNTVAGTMKIYLNGELWHEGSGLTKPISLDRLTLGANWQGNNLYPGLIDEFRVWNKELTAEEIKDWMHRSVTPEHPQQDRLVAYYPLDEGQGTVSINMAQTDSEAVFRNTPRWQSGKGSQLFTNFRATNSRPSATFLQGDIDVSTADVTVTDTVQNLSRVVNTYEVQGTDLVLVDTEFLWDATDEVLVSEAGEVLESYPVAVDGTINVETLDYFRKLPSQVEIMSFVTPYGIFLDLGEEGKTWTFDMTDFTPILKGTKRMFLGNGGENQEEMDIKFHFIKGTPPREVLDFRQIWRPQSCNHTNIQADNCFEARDVTLSEEGTYFKIRSMVTGHGQEGEFIPRLHTLRVDGINTFSWQAWTECGDNPVYPQGGTWIYDRAGWCPGAATDLQEWDLTQEASAGETINLDYTMFLGTGDTRYIASHQLVTYGEYNFDRDGAITDILRPTDKVEYARENPTCQEPVIVLQNTGGSEMTSAQIRYQVGNGPALTYAWTGSLLPMESVEVTLPVTDVSFWSGASGVATFSVDLLSVNGSTDEYDNNNVMQSTFTAPDIFNTGNITFSMKTNNFGNQNTYSIRDFDGNFLFNRTSMGSNQSFDDELSLAPGCYILEITDSADNGLDFWALPGQGTGYIYMTDGTNLLKLIDPDFGSGVKYTFAVGSVTNVSTPVVDYRFELSPNPTNGSFVANYFGNTDKPMSLVITDVTGKELIRQPLAGAGHGSVEVDLTSYTAGMYYATLILEGGVITKKVIKL